MRLGREGIYNQWLIIRHSDGSTEAVAREAGGALVGAIAKEAASHVESTWERGQTVLETLRDELADDV